jgi:hypothetical protein
MKTGSALMIPVNDADGIQSVSSEDLLKANSMNSSRF